MRLEGISKHISFQRNPFLEKLQKDLWLEYEALLIQEESYWLQQSRCNTIKFGDKNSKYFHAKASGRKRRNKVIMLKNEDGIWVDDIAALKAMGIAYFQELYKKGNDCERFIISGEFSRISEEELNLLGTEVSDKEIKSALFSMGSWKAPGPDGLPAMFFQHSWELVGDSLYSWIKDVFQDPSKLHAANNTHIAIIPKVNSPESFLSSDQLAYAMSTTRLLLRFWLQD